MLVRSTSTHRDWLFFHGARVDLICVVRYVADDGRSRIGTPDSYTRVVLLCSVLFSLNAVSVSVSAAGSAMELLAKR